MAYVCHGRRPTPTEAAYVCHSHRLNTTDAGYVCRFPHFTSPRASPGLAMRSLAPLGRNVDLWGGRSLRAAPRACLPRLAERLPAALLSA